MCLEKKYDSGSILSHGKSQKFEWHTQKKFGKWIQADCVEALWNQLLQFVFESQFIYFLKSECIYNLYKILD